MQVLLDRSSYRSHPQDDVDRVHPVPASRPFIANPAQMSRGGFKRQWRDGFSLP